MTDWRRRARQLCKALGFLIVAGACGCNNEAKTIQQLYDRADALKVDLDRCMEQVGDRDAQIAVLERRIHQESAFAGIDLKDLFTVHHIELASLTGGANYNNQPGDDGVTVYLRPLDQDGDVIKAAGQVTVQLLDLSKPGKPRELGVYVFDNPKTLAECWYSGLLTNHYTFKCPFRPQAEPLDTREVLVQVTFLDWLTGRSFSASKSVKINWINPENALVPRSTGV